MGGPSISIPDKVVPVADAIKSAIGRHPVVVVTAKDSMNDEDRTIFETSLHGFGIPRVVFIENYLIEDDGTTPKNADIKMEKHMAFLDVLDDLQMEYDGWLRALYELDAKAYERSKKNRRHQHED
ncbi:uncharacterized protein LOC117121885 [Anneissia japonica]|uniref:uncharacterized protein LOC117121885 n=1 Tax=Anneissia japonica TaxID=1529436 RepID=UPI00142570B0|nr:uncharacterized protein LOC117121885 [Anneissia japonica]